MHENIFTLGESLNFVDQAMEEETRRDRVELLLWARCQVRTRSQLVR